jgi:predicted amidophosphoribosyltransferase
MTSKLRAPKVCPVCAENVPRTALACPECGADHTSGWREDAEAYDAVDFNYKEFVKQESGSSPRLAIKRVWWITAILLLAAFIAIYFYAAH